MKNHLLKEHEVNEHMANSLRNLVTEHFTHLNSTGTMKCMSCNYNGKDYLYDLMSHLINVHHINVHPLLRPKTKEI